MSENHTGPSTQKGKPRFDLIRPVAEQSRMTKIRPMSEEETGILDRVVNMIQLPARAGQISESSNNNTGHSRENFDTRAMAQVARQFGKDDALIVGGITLAITVGIYWFVPGDVALYGLGWLVIWGSISLFFMNQTRSQAYMHSPTGVALRDSDNSVKKHLSDAEIEIHRINTAAEVAKYAIDSTSQTMIQRWRIESGKDE